MIEIIPAIDIIGGKCVRLSQGDYSKKKIYNESPLEVAKQFEDCGCKRLHLVDLDGAMSHHIVNWKILENIATHTSLSIDFGGGLKSDEDAHIAFESGAKMITGGSVAVKNPILFEHWLKIFGPEKIILGADANHGKIAVSGWREESNHDIIPFIKHGMLQGPSLKLYTDILSECNDIYLIASGGTQNMSDVEALNELHIPEVIVGKAIYEGLITISDITKLNLQRNVG